MSKDKLYTKISFNKSLFFIKYVVGLVALSSAAICFAGQDPKVWYEHGTLNYFGDLTSKGEKKVEKIYDNLPSKPNWLVIASGGGDAISTLDFANWIRDNHLNVRVKSACASSCANYVFPAGEKKKIDSDAVLLWHGGACTDYKDKKKWGIKFLKDWRKKENEFYDRIGVFFKLPCLGQDESVQEKIKDGQYIGWTYTLDALRRMGMKNISITNGKDWHPDYKIIKGDVFTIRSSYLPAKVKK